MSTFKNKNSLKTIEAEISKKVKNNEARPKCTGSFLKSVYPLKDRQQFKGMIELSIQQINGTGSRRYSL